MCALNLGSNNKKFSLQNNSEYKWSYIRDTNAFPHFATVTSPKIDQTNSQIILHFIKNDPLIINSLVDHFANSNKIFNHNKVPPLRFCNTWLLTALPRRCRCWMEFIFPIFWVGIWISIFRSQNKNMFISGSENISTEILFLLSRHSRWSINSCLLLSK